MSTLTDPLDEFAAQDITTPVHHTPPWWRRLIDTAPIHAIGALVDVWRQWRRGEFYDEDPTCSCEGECKVSRRP